MKPSELTGIELNKGIAKLAHPDYFNPQSFSDYCNNWNDLMPLVVKLRIIHVPYKDKLWEVYCYEYSDCIEPRYPGNEGLLRSLAEVVYLVLQEKAND